MLASTGEVKIHDILVKHNIPFVEEYEFPDLVSTSGRKLRFDFCVFDSLGRIDFLIEFQGRQHYQAVKKFGGKAGVNRQKYNDSLKRKYCMLRGYNLVTIPFWDEKKISYEYIMNAAGH